MNYKIVEKDKGIVIEGIKDFVPEHILDCGQSFRWVLEDDKSYTGVAMGRVINVNMEGNNVIFNNTDLDDFKNIWYDYFDFGRDYGKIKEKLSKDDVLKEAIKYGEGIRILNQDEWEILISFIISANNRIPMIKRAVNNISQRWGKHIFYNGKTYYSFPKPDVLANATADEIKECGTGFRAKYISETAKMVSKREVDLYGLKDIGYENARQELLKFPGVGPKVSDCILLFSMGYYKAFPVDVWVKRVMRHFYVAEDVSLKKIEEFAQDRFKDLSGFAQEYLFYYARNSMGKDELEQMSTNK